MRSVTVNVLSAPVTRKRLGKLSLSSREEEEESTVISYSWIGPFVVSGSSQLTITEFSVTSSIFTSKTADGAEILK